METGLKKFARRCGQGISALLLALAVFVGGSVVAARLRESGDPAVLAPKTGAFVAAGDASIFVQDQGTPGNPGIIFIHGTGAWGELWRDTLDPVMRAGYRVYAPDMPPFGFSEKLSGVASYGSREQAQRILGVIAALKISKPVIVCHSVGCRGALEALLEKPELFSKAVLVDPALGFDSDPAHPHHGINDAAGAVRLLLTTAWLRNAIIATYGTSPWSIAPIFKSFVDDKNSVTDARLDLLKRPLAVRGLTAAEGDWLEHLSLSNDGARVDDFSNYAKLEVPLLLVWGTRDTVTPPWQGDALEKMFPHATLEKVAGAGHIPYLEKTADFNKLLLRFLKGE